MGNPNTKKILAVYTVRSGSREGAKEYWMRIGTAIAHESGEGFNIVLNANPLDGKLVLMPPKDLEEVGPEAR